jgi:hypothetical protein
MEQEIITMFQNLNSDPQKLWKEILGRSKQKAICQ